MHPDLRRQRIAAQLVRAVEVHLEHKGARRVTTLVAYDALGADAFWDASGIQRIRTFGRHVKNLPGRSQLEPDAWLLAPTAGGFLRANLVDPRLAAPVSLRLAGRNERLVTPNSTGRQEISPAIGRSSVALDDGAR